MKTKRTEIIIGELVTGMDYSFTASSITDNLDGTYTLESCNTKHLQSGYIVTIDAVDYTITAVDVDNSITIMGSPLPTTLVFDVYQPFYKYGTIITTNNELDKENDALDILPLVYLRTEFEETFNNRDSSFDRESAVEIFFLTQNDFSMTESEIESNGVLPMRNLAEMFIESLNKNKDIGIFTDYKIKNWLRFGFETQNGTTKKIFNYCDMSGCQLSITLPISKNLACCKN